MSESIVKTSCKDCVFASWDEGVQDGCVLNRLEKFIDRNELYPTKPDEWFRTINRLCNTCRNQEWANKQMIAGFTYKEDMRQLSALVEKEIAVNYAVILIENSKDDEGISCLKIWESCEHLIQQKHKPERIIIAINNPNIDRTNLLKQVRNQFSETGIKYYISYIIDQQNDLYEIIDCVFSSIDNQYYTILNSGYLLPKDFGTNLNNLINVDLKKTVVIKAYDNIENGLTISCILHKILSGNKGVKLTNKIEEINKQHPNPEAIIECFPMNSQ